MGYVSRLADALFSLTLLARGRVPGGDVEGARVLYGRLMEQEEHYGYHGRVVRQDGWIVLQYWFFYAFNDWRSNFFGANDHEADWEKVFVYLSESESGDIRPEWVAYSAHEESGDDLRRRWDDPELAGSANIRGLCLRWLARQPLLPRRVPDRTGVPSAVGVSRDRRVARSFWYRALRQYSDEYSSEKPYELFTIPFVDYGRGDGVVSRTGSGQGVGPLRAS